MTEDKLEITDTQLRTLKEVLSVCIHCRRLRNKDGKWEIIKESTLKLRLGVLISHTTCPECTRRLFSPEMAEKILKE